jgi:hypothetical protein
MRIFFKLGLFTIGVFSLINESSADYHRPIPSSNIKEVLDHISTHLNQSLVNIEDIFEFEVHAKNSLPDYIYRPCNDEMNSKKISYLEALKKVRSLYSLNSRNSYAFHRSKQKCEVYKFISNSWWEPIETTRQVFRHTSELASDINYCTDAVFYYCNNGQCGELDSRKYRDLRDDLFKTEMSLNDSTWTQPFGQPFSYGHEDCSTLSEI